MADTRRAGVAGFQIPSNGSSVRMRYLNWIVKLLLFLVLLGFALKNTAPVEVRFFLAQSWRAPLSLVLFLFFAAGAALGVAAALSVAYRQRRELEALRHPVPPARRPDPGSDIPAV
jgi:lipopolysaccharide assembly protein A